MKKILLFLSFLLMSIGVWGETISLTQSQVTTFGSNMSPHTSSYSNDYNIDGWTGRYAIAKRNEPLTYSLQLGYNTSSSIGAYNSHLTIPLLSGSATSITISTKSHNGNNTSSGRKFYLCKSDNLGYVNDSHLPSAGTYGSGEITENNGSVTITIIGNPTQFHIYPNGTAYISSITVTYSSTPTPVIKDTVFWLANGDTIYKDTVEHNSQVDTVPHISINDYCDDEFIGWISSTYQGSTQPSGLFTNATKPTITKDTTFYAVFGNYENGNLTSFFKTELNEITTSDVFIIVGKANGIYYAMSNDNGSEKAPDAPIISPYNDCILSPHDSILWKLSGNNDDGYIFYSYSDNTKWLYSTNQNNGIRVGTGNAKHFTVNNAGYLTTDETDNRRYVGVYVANPDWRSYTSIHNNIKNNNGTYEDFYFYKGTRTIDEYHTNTDCVRKFNNAQNDSLWTTKGNWTNNKIPTIKYIAQIDTAVIVDTTHAVAKHVIINQNTGNGKIIIRPNKGLEVDSTIVVSKNNSYHPTTPNDLILESSNEGNASLIFNNNNESQATVAIYSIASIDRINNKWNWQYIGTPMASVNALYNYYDSWLYEWVESDGWTAVPNGGTMYPWRGYCITQESPEWYGPTGTLIPTDDIKDLTLTVPAGEDMVFANSWTAPIHISKMSESGFVMNPMNVYLFNTGSAPTGSREGTEAGTHVVIPIHAAPYVKDTFIAPQQGFFVTNKNGASEGSIVLNYKKLVRGSDSIVAGPMHAPRRSPMADDKPDVLKIYANGSQYGDNVVILAREDFSTEFDNGWDGEKSSFGTLSPSIYVVNNDGSYDAVSAIPNCEGTLLGFMTGSDSVYSLTFEYDGDETLYLNDMLMQESTLIDNESTYVFMPSESDDIRFAISATPYHSVSTNIDNSNADSNTPHKFLHNGNLYIFKNNCIFNIAGSLIRQ